MAFIRRSAAANETSATACPSQAPTRRIVNEAPAGNHRSQIMKRTLGTALLAIAIALPATAAFADSDHDKARAALVAGEIQPLPKILQQVAQQYPGDVLEVELEREHGRWVYEFKILQSDGKLLKLDVDAKDASVIGKREGRR